MDAHYSIHPMGDNALTIEFGNTVTAELNNLVWQCHTFLLQHRPRGVKSLVGAYNSICLHYDAWEVKTFNRVEGSTFRWLKQEVMDLLKKCPDFSSNYQSAVHLIPVCYENAFAPDLTAAAELLGLTTETVINTHLQTTYRVYLIGFLPGFLYLGSLPASLHLKRKSAPAPIKKGSVAIAGWQTGIYPSDAPGGWHCIGRTPLPMFQTQNVPPFPWIPGNDIQFVRITEAEFYETEKMGRWEY
jgi:inhibitor of KinA